MLSAPKYARAALLVCVRHAWQAPTPSSSICKHLQDTLCPSTRHGFGQQQTRFMGRSSVSKPANRTNLNGSNRSDTRDNRLARSTTKKHDAVFQLPVDKSNYVKVAPRPQSKSAPSKGVRQNDKHEKSVDSVRKKPTPSAKNEAKREQFSKTGGKNTTSSRAAIKNGSARPKFPVQKGDVYTKKTTSTSSNKKTFAFGTAIHTQQSSTRTPISPKWKNVGADQKQSPESDKIKVKILHKRVRRRPLQVKWDGKAVYVACPQANTIISALRRLENGLPVCVKPENRYSSVIRLYSRLKNRLGERDAIASFDDHQKYTRRVRKVFENLLLPLGHINGEVRFSEVPGPAVPKEWLPEGPYIPIRTWFGLQSAAFWAQSGVKYKQLDHTIYPQPGCYFAVPSSAWVCEHFALFDDWLRGSDEKPGGLADVQTAVDVGTGCGVLSLLMLKHGVDHDLRVTAVDINPAAIATVKDTIARLDLTAHLSARFSDLVPSDLETAPDLIVFNPPWFPCAPNNDGNAGVTAMRHDAARRGEENGAAEELLATSSPRTRELIAGDHWLEAASYRDPTLMQSFFDSCYATLAPHGRVCVIYSNYASLVGKEHNLTPIEVELESSDRFELVEMIRRPVPVSRRVKSGKEKGWKADVLRNLDTQLWVLRKRGQ